jgi:uncharacterized protein
MKNNHISGKMEMLKSLIRGYDSLSVAFSGGVDSTFLLAFSHSILGENVQAIISKTPLFSEFEEESAMAFIRQTGIVCQDVTPDVMANGDFIKNEKNRCYICKKILLKAIMKKSHETGINRVAHGVNADDLNDYRPGIKAAEELGVLSPLSLAGFTKKEIREASRIMGLPTADKPQMACLASRIPYGNPVTLEKLSMIERSESVLRTLGFHESRVRHHDTVARIEVKDGDFGRIMTDDVRRELGGPMIRRAWKAPFFRAFHAEESIFF